MNGLSPLSRRATLIWLLVILGVASLLRLWQIGLLPPGFHLDESFEGLEALRMTTEPGYRPIFVEGNFGLAPGNIWANALSFTVAGWFGIAPGPTVMRVTAAIFGILGVAALWALAHELALLNRAAPHPVPLTAAFPLFAAAALAVMRWHVHFSRMGIEPILLPLGWALSTALLLRGWRTGSWAVFVALGVALAATFYSYQGAWHYPVVLGITALLLIAGERGVGKPALGRRLGGLALAFGLALLLVAPLLLYLARHVELALLRPTQISVVGATSSPADSSVFTTTWQTLAMFWPFGATGDLDPRRNLPGAPALPLLLALPFFVGVGVALRRLRSPVGWLPLLGLLSLLLAGFVSEYAPHFHRVLGAAAPAALLIGLGLDDLARATAALLQRTRACAGLQRAAAWALPALILLGAAGVGARDYFVRWAALPDLYHAFDAGLWQVGTWMAAEPAATPLYLTPRSTGHPTIAFALARAAGVKSEVAAPVAFDGRNVFPLTDGAAPSAERYVVIEHEDFRTPLLLPQLLPDATPVQSWRDDAGAPYASVWERPTGSMPARLPQVALERALGDGITLLGYDLQPAAPLPGETLYLQLHWRVDAVPATDWTVFTHLRGDDAAAPPLAGKDSQPGGGSLPTPRWQPGWRILDEYQIALPAELAPGSYSLAVGLYTAGGDTLPSDGSISLGTVQIGSP